MIIYKAAIGHDNIGSVVKLTTQPRVGGLNYNVWVATAIGDEPDGAQFCKLLWEEATTPAKLQAVLAQLGLTTAFNSAVTLTLPYDADRKLGYFNCYVSYPKRVEFKDFTLSPEIDVRIVEQLG